MKQALAVLTLLLVLTGCAVGPDYKKPEITTPPAWLVDMQTAKDTANTLWWEQFNDPALNELIATALKQNYDLRIATARVEEFYGRYGATRADLFPQVGYGASAGRTQLSEKGAFAGTPGAGSPLTNLQAQFSASWEIDLWGKVRRATEAAQADLLGAEDVRRGVILSLVTSVATAYVDLRSLDRQLEISKRTVESREKSVKLFDLRFKGGNFGFFDPAKGGDPILFEHMFWIYSHPAIYIMILPAMGVVTDIIPVFARRNIFGYSFIAASTWPSLSWATSSGATTCSPAA